MRQNFLMQRNIRFDAFNSEMGQCFLCSSDGLGPVSAPDNQFSQQRIIKMSDHCA